MEEEKRVKDTEYRVENNAQTIKNLFKKLLIYTIL